MKSGKLTFILSCISLCLSALAIWATLRDTNLNVCIMSKQLTHEYKMSVYHQLLELRVKASNLWQEAKVSLDNRNTQSFIESRCGYIDTKESCLLCYKVMVLPMAFQINGSSEIVKDLDSSICESPNSPLNHIRMVELLKDTTAKNMLSLDEQIIATHKEIEKLVIEIAEGKC
jgi:hypothetical protein